MHYKLYIIKKSSFNYNNVTIPILFCNTAFFFQKRCEAHWPRTLIKFPNRQTLIKCIETIAEREDKHGCIAIGATFIPRGAIHRGVESVI